MALQMTGGSAQVALGPCHADTLHPDLDWLEEQLQGPQPPRMVVIVNPCNPTGKSALPLGQESFSRK
jgi:aspartate/methionine/tyrosine aminotransferase